MRKIEKIVSERYLQAIKKIDNRFTVFTNSKNEDIIYLGYIDKVLNNYPNDQYYFYSFDTKNYKFYSNFSPIIIVDEKVEEAIDCFIELCKDNFKQPETTQEKILKVLNNIEEELKEINNKLNKKEND